MDTEIEFIMKALESKQTGVVNEFLQEKWKQDINIFIDTVAGMRKYNPILADRHLNSGEFVQQFSLR